MENQKLAKNVNVLIINKQYRLMRRLYKIGLAIPRIM
jgi:hypothetical protein